RWTCGRGGAGAWQPSGPARGRGVGAIRRPALADRLPRSVGGGQDRAPHRWRCAGDRDGRWLVERACGALAATDDQAAYPTSVVIVIVVVRCWAGAALDDPSLRRVDGRDGLLVLATVEPLDGADDLDGEPAGPRLHDLLRAGRQRRVVPCLGR